MHRVVILTAMAAFLGGGTQTQAQTNEADPSARKAIQKSLELFEAAHNRHDVKGVLTFYAPAADVRGIGGQMYQGHEAIAGCHAFAA